MVDSPSRLPALLVFMKYPRAGFVKTRLAARTGPKQAADLYRGWIMTVLERVQQLRGSVLVVGCFEGAPHSVFDPWHELVDAWWPQPDGDLGERLGAGFKAWQTPDRPVAAIGTDCLDMSASLIKEAFERLRSHDVVFGPAFDGGYYLVATSRLLEGFFAGVPWSTADTLGFQVARCQQHRLSVGLLTKLHDIDTWEDWLAYNQRIEANP